MAEPFTTTVTRKLRDELGLPIDVPTPQYAGDRGWSWDREQRNNVITEAMDQDMLWAKPRRELNGETLSALKALIEETEAAVRNNLETRAGMTWIEQSRLVQGLLYSWYRATKDRA